MNRVADRDRRAEGTGMHDETLWTAKSTNWSHLKAVDAQKVQRRMHEISLHLQLSNGRPIILTRRNICALVDLRTLRATSVFRLTVGAARPVH